MADKEVKFTEEELKEISVLQSTYLDIQNKLGQLSVNSIRLQQQLNEINKTEESLQNQFIDTQKNESQLIQKINQKYGDGNLNLETGVFTPAPIETQEKTL